MGDISAALKDVPELLVTTTRLVNDISREDISFHCTSAPSTASLLEESSTSLLGLTYELLGQASSTKFSSLRDVESIDANFGSIVGVVDDLLERVDRCLDEFRGFLKHGSNEDDTAKQTPKPKRRKLHESFRTPNLKKPQLDFKEKPFNYETTPFRPFLAEKPHASIGLKESLHFSPNSDGTEQYGHPYAHEIARYEWPDHVCKPCNPIAPAPLESVTATLVNTPDGVSAMLEELKDAKEIAIDLEHHDAHSYIGLVSLMQISTRKSDWIVDTLKPWRRELQQLNKVFADPGIVKVLHGSSMDVVWLQRDLGLYLVGLFDTYHACRVLGYPRASLAFLLEKFVGYEAQKQYQMADWRIRPLPTEMMQYAQSDTHFLLYIYDCLRNELLEKSEVDPRSETDTAHEDSLSEVLFRSKREALQRYEHPFYQDKTDSKGNGWFNALTKRVHNFSQAQIAVFAKIHKWRDDKARDLDEAPFQIMSGMTLENIARAMPTDEARLLGVSHPITPVIREHATSLVSIIRETTDNSRADHDANAQERGSGILDPPKGRSSFMNGIASMHWNLFVEDSQLRTQTSHFWNDSIPNRTGFQDPTMSSQKRLTIHVHGFADGDYHYDGNGPMADTRAGHEAIRVDTEKDDQTQSPVARPTETPSLLSQKRSISDDIPASHKQRQLLDRLSRREDVQKTPIRPDSASRNMSLEGLAQDTDPLDYSKADSVLHSKNHGNVDERVSRRLDPYSKAMQAPPGQRKTQGSVSGRSATFKRS